MSGTSVSRKGIPTLYLVLTAVIAAITGVLDFLGSVAAPIAPGVTAIYPGVAFQLAFGAWFGVWAAIGSYIGPFFSKLFVGQPAPVSAVFNLSNFAQPFITAVAFRALRFDSALRRRRDWIGYVLFILLIPSAVGATIGVGTLVTMLGVPREAFWAVWTAWNIANEFVLVVIGIPLLLIVSPLVKRTRLFVKGYFR